MLHKLPTSRAFMTVFIKMHFRKIYRTGVKLTVDQLKKALPSRNPIIQLKKKCEIAHNQK